MSEKLGIPYMGSKRKLASDILIKLTSRQENITDFYDLFGGGGSISFTAIRDYRFNVHYNELNKHIFSLVEYLKKNKTLEPRFYEWVTREQFFEQCGKSNEEADWYSGFVMSCWSFGNKQSSYIYGSDIEELKHLAHQFIVHGCLDSMNELGVNIPEILDFENIQKRRVLFCKEIEKILSNRFDMQNLESLKYIESLGRLQNLQNLQNLQITNKSYENVLITGDNPVIYCDIPYKGTGEYKEGGFDHEKFYQWFSNLDYPAYLSEYEAPFEKIEMFSHRSSLSATNNKKKVFESIYWNGKGEIIKNTLF
jgi:site-specific DNA-adenine methylase